MTKQKRGLWVFIFSLIPGAGEMYMGFRKQGISIMLLFWGIIALASGLNMGWFLMFLPIIWFYSFFNVHNLKSLTPEEFYSLEDRYILNLGTILEDGDFLLNRYRTLTGCALVLIGGCVLWNIAMDFLWEILPYPLAQIASSLSYRLPQALFAIGFVFLGLYLIRGKKKHIEDFSRSKESSEHYWEPYRPFQQTAKSENSQSSKAAGQPFTKSEDSAKTENPFTKPQEPTPTQEPSDKPEEPAQPQNPFSSQNSIDKTE